MKILSLALASAIPVASAAALSQADKASIVSQFLRDANSQRMLQNGDDANSGISISTNSSIQFDTCISLTTELSDNMKTVLSTYDVIKDYYDEGDIVPLKSYVLFDICETGKCSSTDESNLYMTDLPTYMGLTAFKPQQTTGYCDACVEAEEYCTAATDDGGADGAEDGADGGRRLDIIKYVDCEKCSSMGCFDGGDGKISIDDVLQWALGWSQCQETGVEWNDIPLYATFICNQAGTGVELGVFLDDDCTTYSKVQGFSELFPNSAYHASSGNVVTYPFTHTVSCAEQIQWQSPENENGDNSQQAQNQDQDQSGANEYCQAIMESDFVLALNDCASDNQADEQVDNQEQDQQEEADGEDEYSSWVFDVSVDETQDTAAVCSAVKSLGAKSGSYQKAASVKNHYNEAHGSYSYNKSKANKGNGGKIAGIIIGVLCACALAFFAYKRTHKPKKTPLLEREIQQEL